MFEKTLGDGILKDTVQIVVETAEETPVTIAKITSEFVDIAKGYRVRIKLVCDNQCSLSTGGQGSLP